MVKLTDEEQEIMAWAAQSFKAPWLGLCEAFQRIHAGEKLSASEASVDPYFVPFPIDARLIYHVMKSGGKRAILGENGNMLTIVTNTRGNKIIWAAVEYEEDSVYTQFFPLKDELGGEWDKKGAELIFDGLMEDAFNHFSDWLKSRPGTEHIELGILKVANIQFFGAFKKAYEDAADGSKLALMTLNFSSAVDQIMDEGWIRFHPDINLKKLLELVAPVLNLVSPVNASLGKFLEKLPF